MKTSKTFFRKYILSNILIVLFFIFVNLLLLSGSYILISFNYWDSDIPLSTIANEFKINQNNLTLSNEMSDYLKENNYWAMLLNDNGQVIWEQDLPSNLNKSYTLSEVAQFSRWYLDDYPVLVQTSDVGLLIVGFPKGSLIKLNYITNNETVDWLLYGLPLLLIVNCILILGLSIINMKKAEKNTAPVIDSIKAISMNNEVCLPETGDLRDIKSAINRLSKNINKKEAARAEWINGISHDIRTPLSIILGYASEIEENDSLPEDINYQGSLIRKQGEKLRNLIADLNLTSKLEYSMQPLSITDIDLAELSRQVISEFYNDDLSSIYTISFDNKLDINTPLIKGDKSLLMRMLRNIIQNSISHNENGCYINLSLINSFNNASKNSKNRTPCIEINISDAGVGLTEEQYNAFNKNIYTTNGYTADGGTAHGMGLKLVYQIISSHKGTLYFSPHEPSGLNIVIDLPIE